jgi:2-aminoadipate transaminase
MAAPWAHRYAQRTKSAKSSIIRELLKLTQNPEVISFAGGLPAPEVFPVARFQEACQHVLQTQASAALQYGPTEGYRPLREFIVAHMARYGILAGVDNVLITAGSQQALDLIAKLLINRGDRILVESPTYVGALQAFDLMGAEYVTVPIDDDGLQT